MITYPTVVPIVPGAEVIEKASYKFPLPEQAHAGLVFDRYLAIWEGNRGLGGRTSKLLQSLTAFTDRYNDRKKNHPVAALLHAYNRRMDRVALARGIAKQLFTVSWRMVLGMGNSHPIENGFTFDPLIGVPFVSGSAIKGMCRRMALLEEIGDDLVEELFGPEEIIPEISSPGRGDLLFFDAYPNSWPTLRVDIINCHHSRYYANQITEPVERENPIPVFFLVVDQGSDFMFRFGSVSRSKDNITRVAQLLEKGLDLLGIGGKSSSGYGYQTPRGPLSL
ncbi:MAG: type III-B CRISPR module RAMP protein Cmr6 [Magnetococcus sp. DMHC-6]